MTMAVILSHFGGVEQGKKWFFRKLDSGADFGKETRNPEGCIEPVVGRGETGPATG
jgi:hypothetical protein